MDAANAKATLAAALPPLVALVIAYTGWVLVQRTFVQVERLLRSLGIWKDGAAEKRKKARTPKRPVPIQEQRAAPGATEAPAADRQALPIIEAERAEKVVGDSQPVLGVEEERAIKRELLSQLAGLMSELGELKGQVGKLEEQGHDALADIRQRKKEL